MKICSSVKFTGRFPNFYQELVETFDLMQTGAAKYMEGTTLYAHRKLSAKDMVRNMVL